MLSLLYVSAYINCNTFVNLIFLTVKKAVEKAKKRVYTFWYGWRFHARFFYTKKRKFAVPSLYNQFTTKIMKEG